MPFGIKREPTGSTVGSEESCRSPQRPRGRGVERANASSEGKGWGDPRAKGRPRLRPFRKSPARAGLHLTLLWNLRGAA